MASQHTAACEVLPCVLWKGHAGAHINASGGSQPRAEPPAIGEPCHTAGCSRLLHHAGVCLDRDALPVVHSERVAASRAAGEALAADQAAEVPAIADEPLCKCALCQHARRCEAGPEASAIDPEDRYERWVSPQAAEAAERAAFETGRAEERERVVRLLDGALLRAHGRKRTTRALWSLLERVKRGEG